MQLLDSYLPVFKQVLHITGGEDLTDYEPSRQLCITLFEKAEQEAALQDASADEKEAARIAVIAWLDEAILSSELPWRHHWRSELLQRKYLNITTAGELFFIQLEKLNPAYDEARKVFLFCLQQGFQGQYSTSEDKQPLHTVIEAQRTICLPEQWQKWPNEAEIMPERIPKSTSMSQRLRPLLLAALGVSLLYSILFFALYNMS
ncbi:DotU family type IV/VI secretion system protein [Cedecea neteri]|uniref:DotU family type IV/VI secretion system protein n=1 Tax=Cedecea neteri TaxID=158822 RepID=A0A291E166_9ENTR|nr:DotU family type IV/VI secretion system protein [Cedecea neteri]ATF93815.1 DotU family type IV/VI secretion system protein [Cedecea neteri]